MPYVNISCNAFIRLATFVLILSGCVTPENSGQADVKNATRPIWKLNPFNGFYPNVIWAKEQCNGSAGSPFPPLSFGALIVDPMSKPFEYAARILSLGTVYRKTAHTQINNAEKYFTHQDDVNHCWAATLETSMKILNWRYIKQNSIISHGKELCPQIINNNDRADIYQVIYITHMLEGGVNNDHYFCASEDCIVGSIKRGHPVIMFNSSHVTLIVGLDYSFLDEHVNGSFRRTVIKNPSSEPKTIEKYYFLDPLLGPQVQEGSQKMLYGGDAFLSF